MRAHPSLSLQIAGITKPLIVDLLHQHAYAEHWAEDAAARDGSATVFPFVGKDSPLLPNLGVANIHGYLIDVMVRSPPFGGSG